MHTSCRERKRLSRLHTGIRHFSWIHLGSAPFPLSGTGLTHPPPRFINMRLSESSASGDCIFFFPGLLVVPSCHMPQLSLSLPACPRWMMLVVYSTTRVMRISMQPLFSQAVLCISRVGKGRPSDFFPSASISCLRRRCQEDALFAAGKNGQDTN